MNNAIQTCQISRQLIVIESSCAPFAEADDLIELQPGGFDGDGVYALEYIRPAGCRNWSGLRRVRANCGHLEIQEGAGDWVAVNEAVRFSGKVAMSTSHALVTTSCQRWQPDLCALAQQK